ncbi:unnamed protein product [Heligmosomoides polygyrus]|uniref:valine--tRNA ligase n=1 Tax=Heligmosomoides polygyrus TaxID=6339 RepID=A0A3P7Z974_HELPZ|nr:unnamed protein product [Heligmosomoides polygyrus]
MVTSEQPKQKTEKELKKEAEKAAKLAKFEEKQRKLQEKAAAAAAKPKEGGIMVKRKVTVLKLAGLVVKRLYDLSDVSAGLPNVYDPGYVESEWYAWWEKEGFFKPEYMQKNTKTPNPKGNFTICIPPPNVTGTLHVGHALATTVEDTLTRWNRMKGKTTLFNPGCDHAGIATQVVVEKKLQRERGLSRHDLGRDRFIDEVWKWKNEKGGVIYDQLRKMGASVDWDRACFMMDPKMIRAVTEAFVRMHERGTIYRSNRLVNWSCALRSAISDIEEMKQMIVALQVDKKELSGRTLLPVPGYDEKVEFGILTSFAYKIKGGDDEVVVSTTRVETMLGDTAIAVHPEDPRYQHLIGKVCVHPFVDRELPIVPDSFVDREFGTGAVKITPAHDHNDYEVGIRHNLPFITCINDDGLIAAGCGKFSGMRRFDARKAVTEALKELNLYRGAEDNAMVVPVCSRSKDIIEPLLKAQWYVRCDEMARKAMAAVESGELKLIPDYHVATWNRWLQGSRDWCISRQLWWGHRIPAYFITVNDGKTPVGDPCDDHYWVSAHSEEIAIQKAAKKFNVDPKFITVKWDEDVLDTWFSSGMWPFAIMGWPENTSDMELYFPSNVLETGHDILFFWVARMVFMSQELTGKLPFKEVYLHAMIRDAHGRKMSKSLGNVIDPLDVIRGVTLEDLNRQLTTGNLDAKELAIAQAGQARDYPKVQNFVHLLFYACSSTSNVEGIPECGTDALRFALLAYTSQGRDINLDVLRVQGYRFFCNKIWQAVRFTLMQLGSEYRPEPFKLTGKESKVDLWILSRAAHAVNRCNAGMDAYNFTQAVCLNRKAPTVSLQELRLSGVTQTLYEFWLYDLCDIYLEAVKPVIASGTEESRECAKATLYNCVEVGLRLISPIMPFLSEELWQHLPHRESRPPSIIVHSYPEASEFRFTNEKIEAEVAFAMTVIRTVRSLRSDYELTNKTKTDLFVSVSSEEDHDCLTSLIPLIETLASSNKVEILLLQDAATANVPPARFLKGIINIERELAKLAAKKEKNEALVAKLVEQESRPDYETKVPLPVRVNNTEKVSKRLRFRLHTGSQSTKLPLFQKDALLIEVRSIEAAMAALSS